jgi:hypothetical protein
VRGKHSSLTKGKQPAKTNCLVIAAIDGESSLTL